MTPYEILGVPRDASLEHIKQAHRHLARQHHPDVAGGDTARFQEIQGAFDVLSDPDRRAHYDATGEREIPQKPDKVKALALDLIATLFAMFIMNDADPFGTDLVAVMNGAIDAELAELAKKAKPFERGQARIAKMRGRFKLKKGGENNLMESSLKWHEARIENELAPIYERRAACECAKAIIADYDFTREQLVVEVFGGSQQGMQNHKFAQAQQQAAGRGFFGGL